MIKIGIIIGSTRPGRVGESVGRWVLQVALKNAIDFLYREWNNKAAGFVGYGGLGGTRAVENLRSIVGELEIADVRSQVALSLKTDFKDFSVFKPAAHQAKSVNKMLDQVIAWSGALKNLRETKIKHNENQ
jgi:NAD(P)H-dependent FMN reductase